MLHRFENFSAARTMAIGSYCMFSHDVMAAIFVSQTIPVRVELFSYAPINVMPAGGEEAGHRVGI